MHVDLDENANRGEKARAIKARYVGVCRGCGASTQPRNGKGGLCVLQALPRWRDRTTMDPGARACGDA